MTCPGPTVGPIVIDPPVTNGSVPADAGEEDGPR